MNKDYLRRVRAERDKIRDRIKETQEFLAKCEAERESRYAAVDQQGTTCHFCGERPIAKGLSFSCRQCHGSDGPRGC
jgi:hypothetical protein